MGSINDYFLKNSIKLIIIGVILLMGGFISSIVLAFLNQDENGFIRDDAPKDLIILGIIIGIIGILIIAFTIYNSTKNLSRSDPLKKEQLKQDYYNPRPANGELNNFLFNKVIAKHKKKMAKKNLSLMDEQEFWKRAYKYLQKNESPILYNISKIGKYINYFYEKHATTAETAIPLDKFFQDKSFINSQTTMYISNEIINYNLDCSVYLNVPKIKHNSKLFAGTFVIILLSSFPIMYFFLSINWILFGILSIILVPFIMFYWRPVILLNHYKRKFQDNTSRFSI